MKKGKKRQRNKKNAQKQGKNANIFTIFKKGILMLSTVGMHEKTKICCALFKYFRNYL